MKHTHEQGQRVNYIANLGGLVVLAGLSTLEPEVLLGVLLEAKIRADEGGEAFLADAARVGSAALKVRAAEKRAWKSYQKAIDLRPVYLNPKEILEALKTNLVGGSMRSKFLTTLGLNEG